MLKPAVRPRGGEISHSPGASPATPGPCSDTRQGSREPQRGEARGRPRPPAGQGRPSDCPRGRAAQVGEAGRVGAGGSARPRQELRICGRTRGGQSQGRGRSRAGARGALTSCSAQRQMSEQRPVQQPMVPAASERRARREIRVLRRRCLPTPEQPPPGACPARPGPSSPAPRPPPAARRSALSGSGLAQRLC